MDKVVALYARMIVCVGLFIWLVVVMYQHQTWDGIFIGILMALLVFYTVHDVYSHHKGRH